jgi:DNA-directed RNA polymerase subunit beta'
MSAEKETSINNNYSSGMEFNSFESIRIGLASPEKIRSWSHGEVKKPETINYRTLKPERDGLFCERIFGPTKDWECHCGKYKRFRYKGKVCERCGVEITKSKVRRERMGHIELAAPVSHIWYFKGIPSRLGQMLDIQPRQLESVLYFGAYIVLDDGGIPEIKKKQTLTEKEYLDLYEKYGDDFRVGMGAEAIKELLVEIDLDKLSEELKAEMKDANGQKKIKLLKRFEVVESFRTSGNRPEWMILDVIPVIPPEIRPMVQLDGGRFATSDLNDLYRRVINRNNRLRKLLELSAPAIIIRNEKRMLQEAVDALIDNGRRGKPVSGPNNRALKSLSDILKGKQGRFRQNLLGKRVDYSGRSVIVVGPELKIYQCGLPKEMALELFKPFVMKRLSELGIVQNIKSAKKMVERSEAPVWDALETVIKEYPVLLNRAPTLHRLGIQAFEPVLVEGRALKLHPLVCTAFNADFDGDQMAVHVPLSAEAQAEARFLMLSANNLLRPQDGMPVAVPSQDMILGSYYLTIIKYDEPGVTEVKEDDEEQEGIGIITAKPDKSDVEKKYRVKIFKDFDEALMAYDAGAVGLHAPIKVRIRKEYKGNIETRLINATVGQIIFNRPIPQDLGFVNREDPEKIFDLEITNVAKKSELKKIIDRCIKVHGITKTAEVLDMIKAQGYKYSTKGAITISVSDMEIPPEKAELVHKADVEVEKITKHFRRGLISDDERYAQVVSVWNSTTNEVTKALQQNLSAFNPINMMAVSGARGSIDQIRQLCGMRGLMANTTGRTVDVPIRANFREGLTVLEYFVSSKGARKGQADTALRTADSGYLTRRLVDVSQDVIVREDDCGSTDGIVVRDIRDGDEILESFQSRLIGRFPVEDVIDPKTGEVICPNTRYIRDADAKRIVAAGYKELKLRSVLTCECRYGVCAKCYGMNLATSETVNVGEAVGIIAAQSIGEPGTQLTMRTFHTGGVAGSSDITQGLPRVQELFEARHPKRLAILSETNGELSFQEMKHARYAVIKNDETGEVCQYLIPYSARLKVKEGDFIRKGDELTEGAQDPQDILRVKSEAAVEEYITQEIQKVYHSQAVDINDKHIEIIIRQMMRKVRITEPGDTGFMLGSVVDRAEVKDVNRKLLAANPDAVPAEYQTMLLGITKSALATESFLSAASFQETTKILTDAAIKGKTDMLVGLKENVIIGKLIPAGTGLERYRNVEITELDGSENAG